MPPVTYQSVFREESMPEIDYGKRASRTSYHSQPSQPSRKLKEPTFNHKPLALRSLSLLCLIAITLGLFGVLEYALLKLPHGSRRLVARGLDGVQYVHDLDVRQASSSVSQPASSVADSSAPSSTPISSSISGSSGVVASQSAVVTIPSSAYAHKDTVIVSSSSAGVTSAIESSAYAHKDTVIVTSSLSESTTPTPSPSSSLSSIHASPTPISSVHVHSGTPVIFAGASSAYVHSDYTESTTRVSPSSSSAIQSAGSGKGHKSGSDGNGLPPNPTHDEGKSPIVYYLLGTGSTFSSTYMPILAAVIYRMMWTMIFNGFSLIDPFRQLTEPHGALAERAFFSFYQSQSNLLGPIPALMKRRWALALVATTYFLVCLLPAFASESVFVSTDWGCKIEDPNQKKNPCHPKVFANVIIIRILQSLLGLAGFVALCITSVLLLKKTGLPDDPRSIATLASLMQNPGLRDDFNEMPVTATASEMARILEGKRYQLGFYKLTDGGQAYGIRPAAAFTGDYTASSLRVSHKYTPIDGWQPWSDQGKDASRRFRVLDILLALLIPGTLGVVIAYYFARGRGGFNNFFNSDTFGPRFILTLAGTAIATLWKSAEQSTAMIAPYARLAKRPSAPNGTILFTPSTTPISSTLRAFRHGYFSIAAITIVTLTADLGLNIVISGVPYARGETIKEFRISVYMTMGILGVMMIVVILLIISRFREPRIPRQPHTLGAVMSYMSGSRLIDDFEGMELMDGHEKHDRICSMGKRYEFRETMRRDGKIAWAVDVALDRRSYY